MWTFVARIILRNRTFLLVLSLLATAFMFYQGQSVKISYKFSRILPQHDSTQLLYEDFKETFGEVGNTVVMGAADPKLFEAEALNAWHELGDSLLVIDGVEQVLGATRAYDLRRNDSLHVFELSPLDKDYPYSNNDAAALKAKLDDLPFYRGLLYTPDHQAAILLVQLRMDVLYNKEIIRVVESIKKTVERFESRSGIEMHTSGLPYIRMANTTKIKAEVYVFIALALAVTSLLLLFFLKSFRAMLVSMLVVIFGVIWSFGLISILDFEITLLSSLIPPLVIVIGVPNCIFLINKYHTEYKGHGNKVLALQRVIRKIGNATLMTNTTTALGFFAFVLTDSVILKEFGFVAAVNILVVFLLSIILIPIAYSFMAPPRARHYEHLEKRWLNGVLNFLERTTLNNRPAVYLVLVLAVGASVIGMVRMKVTGNISDDFSKDDPVYLDLKFLENHFKGVVPLEIVVDTREENGVQKLATLKRMDRFQRALDTLPELSRSISIADLVKFSVQAYYSGSPDFYTLPTSQDRNFILSYFPRGDENRELLSSFINDSGSKARISVQVADLGTKEMKALQKRIEILAAEVFPQDRYDITVTGASVIFLKGTRYLIKNLITSLLLAIVVIAILMSLLFRTYRMVLVSLLPNLVPLVVTGGLMGYLGIPLKPSTILVFSIAFGISVDDTIHFLAKYRQELKSNGWRIREAVLAALRETGVSMFYTSVVLFFGFSIFIASEFGGTSALGVLVSITLLFAMFSNLLILPSLLLTLENKLTMESFGAEPLVSLDEEEDPEDRDEEAPQRNTENVRS